MSDPGKGWEDPWGAATWEGSRRLQLRRWAALPLEQILAAQEEMHALADALSEAGDQGSAGAAGREGTMVREAALGDEMAGGRHALPLHGCTPVPLASYLKALGILRLVTEQADPGARGCWQNEHFLLESRLDGEELRRFFLEEYQPTPLLAPWGARSGFYPGSAESGARKILQQIETTAEGRLEAFRQSIESVRSLLERHGFSQKPDDDRKLELLRLCRSELPEELVQWLDACYTLTAEGRRFPPLLGTGGNEGSGSYLSGFGQLVLDCVHRRRYDAALGTALFGTGAPQTSTDQVPGQFAPDMAGGPNQGLGYTGDVTTNPWDYLLALEGTLLFSSASTRRLGSQSSGNASFPFTVQVTGAGTGNTAIADEQGARAEMWAPIWGGLASAVELRAVLNEGRVTLGDRPVREGLDFARAVSRLGVDRGVSAFQRYAFVQRYGRNVFAVPLNRVNVQRNPAADLIEELDVGGWLDRFRRHARRDGANRLASLARRLEDAVFELATRRDDTAPAVRRLLSVLGAIQLYLARSPAAREACRPVPSLSCEWLTRSDDGTPEMAIAAALAGLQARAPEGGWALPMRIHLAPESPGKYPSWAVDDTRAVTWAAGAAVADNLADTLHRRLLDAGRGELPDKPLYPARTAPLGDIATWLAGELDEHRLAHLLPGLMLVRIPGGVPPAPREAPLPAAYRLLKPLFCTDEQLHRAGALPADRTLPLKADLLRRLEADDVAGALELGRRRRRAAGLGTGFRQVAPGIADGRRLLAALMVPVSDSAQRALLPAAVTLTEGSETTGNA